MCSPLYFPHLHFNFPSVFQVEGAKLVQDFLGLATDVDLEG